MWHKNGTRSLLHAAGTPSSVVQLRTFPWTFRGDLPRASSGRRRKQGKAGAGPPNYAQMWRPTILWAAPKSQVALALRHQLLFDDLR